MLGIKDRSTNRKTAKVARVDHKWRAKWDKPNLQAFVRENAKQGAELYTDDHACYNDMVDIEHYSVKRSAGEYVNDMAHTNGVESFRAMIKRGYTGVSHKMSFKYFHRYVKEFVWHHNVRHMDTKDQMAALYCGLEFKRLAWKELTAESKPS